MDSLSVEQRSEIMSRVRSKNTRPELFVRRLAHAMGYRYRLHAKDLPGTPDMVFKSRGKVVFVHGCFWHRHANCCLARLPKSKPEFWLPKLSGNAQRDRRHQAQLRRLGWRCLTVWECQLRDPEALGRRLKRFLDG